MLSKKNRKNRKRVKGYTGGGEALKAYYEGTDPNQETRPKFAEITRELVDSYGYPEKYIGYKVALTKDGVEKPFTIPEMCELCWAAQRPLFYDDIDSPVSQDRINQQLNVDINRDIDIKINDEDVKKSVDDEEDKDYNQFINSKLSDVSSKELYAIKSLLNQFPLSSATDVMVLALPKYEGEQIQVYPLNPNIIKMHKTTFPDISNTKLILVNKEGNKVIVDESNFTALMIIDPLNKDPDNPIIIIGVAKVCVYCDFDKNVGFFIWKNAIKEEEPTQEQQGEEEQAKTSINNIVLGSIGAAVVATGAVVGTLFGVGILGGKSKKARKMKKAKKTRRKKATNTKNKKNKKKTKRSKRSKMSKKRINKKVN